MNEDQAASWVTMRIAGSTPSNALPVPGRRRVLLFEDKAHHQTGHFPHWVAQLAAALLSDGHEVHILTTYGWALEAEGQSMQGIAQIHKLPARFRVALRLGTIPSALPSIIPIPFLQDLTALTISAFQQAALALAIRHRTKTLGRQSDTVVLVLSMTLRATWAALFAPRKARWVVYEHWGPAGQVTSPALRRLRNLGGRIEALREAAGGVVRVAANNPEALEGWNNRYPWLKGGIVPAAGRFPVEPEPKEKARAALGLQPPRQLAEVRSPEALASWRIALHFGFAHQSKDLYTVFSAFSRHPHLGHLVVAGKDTAEHYADWRDSHPRTVPPEVTIIDGYVPEQTKHLLYSAADYVVLSFKSGTINDSGTLADAVAYGLPVCCSDTGFTGRMVREYKLGVLYAPSDQDSLRAMAEKIKTFQLDPKSLEKYRIDRSPVTLARLFLGLGVE